MKKIMKSLVLSLLMGLAVITGQAAVTVPVTEDNGTTAGTTTNAAQYNTAIRSAGGSVVTFKVLPSFGPPQNAASFPGYVANAVSLIKSSGTLPIGERTSPADASLLEHIVPEDLMTTTSLPFYRGVFSPDVPWNNERGGTVWWWVDATASEGETISLADISMVLSSSDIANALYKTEEFSGPGVGYSPTSPGIRADGSEITSGPANQQVKRVIVGVGSKSFPVSSASGVQTVRNYLNSSVPNWTATSVVTVKGVSDTFTLPLSKAPPRLIAQRSGSRFLVIAENNGDPTVYDLQSSTSLGSSAVWSPAGSISAGQTNDVTASVEANSVFFVRLIPPIVPE